MLFQVLEKLATRRRCFYQLLLLRVVPGLSCAGQMRMHIRVFELVTLLGQMQVADEASSEISEMRRVPVSNCAGIREVVRSPA